MALLKLPFRSGTTPLTGRAQSLIQSAMASAGGEACGICPSTRAKSQDPLEHALCESSMNNAAIEGGIIEPGNRLMTPDEIAEATQSGSPEERELAAYHNEMRSALTASITRLVKGQLGKLTP